MGIKLNVACGFKYKPGYVNIDMDRRLKVDLYRNLEQGLPFSDDIIEEILSEHTLEHINPDMIHFVMYEFWRVLQPGGRLKVVVPINKGWASNPEHKCPWGSSSVIFFTDWNFREPYKFKLVSEKTLFVDETKPETEELHFELECVK